MRLALVSAPLVTLALAAVASADFDLSPNVGADRRIVVNAFQDATEEFVPNVRVFGYAFGEEPGQPFFLPDPGFHPLPGSGYAEGTSVGFELAAPLQYWAGDAGEPTFANVSSGGASGGGASLRFDFGANSVVSTGGAVPSPVGYSIAAVDARGEADDHLETFLLAPGGTIAEPGMPAEGIYLATIRVTSTAADVFVSEPAYLLFANGASEETLADAVLAVRDERAPGSNLAGVPEPTTLAVVAATAGFVARRRRR